MSNAGAPGAERETGWDFFISYTSSDRRWAEWVAWQLEDAGYSVLVQAWDFVLGSNWQDGMERGMRHAIRTVALISQDYLHSVYGQEEWQAAQRADSHGFARRLLPIRVENCPLPGPLDRIVTIDLFGCSQETARDRLRREITGAVAGRAKPAVEPAFPVEAVAEPAPAIKPLFPGRPWAAPRWDPPVGPGATRTAPGATAGHGGRVSPARSELLGIIVRELFSRHVGPAARSTLTSHARGIDRALVVLAYLPILGWFTGFRNNQRVRFHAAQALVIDILAIVGITAGTIGYAHTITALYAIGETVFLSSFLGLRVWAAVLAARGKPGRLPRIGDLADRAARRAAPTPVQFPVPPGEL